MVLSLTSPGVICGQFHRGLLSSRQKRTRKAREWKNWDDSELFLYKREQLAVLRSCFGQIWQFTMIGCSTVDLARVNLILCWNAHTRQVCFSPGKPHTRVSFSLPGRHKMIQLLIQPVVFCLTKASKLYQCMCFVPDSVMFSVFHLQFLVVLSFAPYRSQTVLKSLSMFAFLVSLVFPVSYLASHVHWNVSVFEHSAAAH